MEEPKMLTPIKAIRAKCLDCSCGNPYEVEKCVIPKCPLYPYRMGKNPNRAGTIRTEEQKAAARERMARINEQKKAKNAQAEASDT